MDQFCLRWENHQKTFMNVLHNLLTNERLVDVTISADGQNIGAHKVVLTACSGYFEKLFSECVGDKHPVVFLKDVKFEELKCLLHYMYFGEVNVAQDQLPQLIKTAESLKIKGLSDGGEEKNTKSSETIYGLPNPLETQTNDLNQRSIGSPYISSKRKRFKAARPLETDSLVESPVLVSSPNHVYSRSPNPSSNDLLKNIGDESLEISPIIMPTSQAQTSVSIPIPPSNTPPVESDDAESIKSDIKIKTEKQEVFEEVDQCLDEGPSHFTMESVSDKDESNTNWANMFEDSQDQLQFNANASQDNPSGVGEDTTRHICDFCGRHYKQRYTLYRHLRYECGNRKCFKCLLCMKDFRRKCSLLLHQRSVHHITEPLQCNEQAWKCI